MNVPAGMSVDRIVLNSQLNLFQHSKLCAKHIEIKVTLSGIREMSRIVQEAKLWAKGRLLKKDLF